MIRAEDIIAIPKSSNQYPEALKTLSDAPETLYAVGDIRLLNTSLFTMVGSRKTATAALQWCAQTAKELSEKFTLVTGVAEGGDGAVTEGALAGSGKIICVLAGGFGSIPQGNFQVLQKIAKHGLLLSPHEYGVPVRNFSYEYRNKLLARLGEGTLVVSAGEKSGTLITAKWARKFEKPVFALPYFPSSATGVGCNALLKTGAILTESATDIFEYYNLTERTVDESATVRALEEQLSDNELRVYRALSAENDLHANAIAEKSGLPVFKIRAILTALEVKGFVTALGGNHYAVTKK